VSESIAAAAPKPKGMCIATRCTTVDQFVDMFHRFVDEDSFFVSTVNTRPPGLETSFSVQLADGTPVLRGLCVVLQAWTTATSPFKTPGVRLGIKRLTANSMPVFERLLVTRSRPTPPPTAPSLASGTGAPPTGSGTEPAAAGFRDNSPTTLLPSPIKAEAAASATTEADAGKTTAEAGSERPQETRTPGSDLVLPANPLMNLSDASLQGYVDCTLYEETGTFFPVDDDGSPIEELLPPPSPPPVLAPRPVGRLSTPVEIVSDEPSPDSLQPLPDPATVRARSNPALRLPTPPPIPGTPVPPARGSQPAIARPALDTIEPLAVTDLSIAQPLPGAPQVARESNAAGELTAQPTQASKPASKRWFVVGGVVAVAGIAALWVAMTSSNGAADNAPPSQKAAIAPPIAPPKPEPATPPPSDSNPPPTTDTTDTDTTDGATPISGEIPLAGDGPCRVVVASTPAGSIVLLDGKAIAPSPITIATECGRHKLDVKHPRYQLGTKQLTLTEGAPANVDMRLTRPTHLVSVTSQPSGATVFINGNRAGTTPTVLTVMGFSNLKLEIKKTGYAPVEQKLYSKTAQDKVAVKLTRW
jgi:hypothetical protein